MTIEVRPGGAFRLDSVSDADGTVASTTDVPRSSSRRGSIATDDAAATVAFTDVGEGRTEMVFHASCP